MLLKTYVCRYFDNCNSPKTVDNLLDNPSKHSCQLICTPALTAA